MVLVALGALGVGSVLLIVANYRQNTRKWHPQKIVDQQLLRLFEIIRICACKHARARILDIEEFF